MDIKIIIMHMIRSHTPKNLQLTFNNKISIKIVNKNLNSIKIATINLTLVDNLKSKTIYNKNTK